MAGAYRQWSQGKPFCALDYPLRLVELNALEQGSGELYKGSWYDLTNETFRASWMEFARRWCRAIFDLGPVLQHAGDDRRDAGGPWQLCGHPLLQ